MLGSANATEGYSLPASTAEDVANGTLTKVASKLAVFASSSHALVLPRFDKEADNGFLAERLSSLQTVQALNEHETRSVGPYEDRRFQALVENARRNLVYALVVKCGAPFHRHVDVGDV